jgi:hypothetical protein
MSPTMDGVEFFVWRNESAPRALEEVLRDGLLPSATPPGQRVRRMDDEAGAVAFERIVLWVLAPGNEVPYDGFDPGRIRFLIRHGIQYDHGILHKSDGRSFEAIRNRTGQSELFIGCEFRTVD